MHWTDFGLPNRKRKKPDRDGVTAGVSWHWFAESGLHIQINLFDAEGLEAHLDMGEAEAATLMLAIRKHAQRGQEHVAKYGYIPASLWMEIES